MSYLTKDILRAPYLNTHDGPQGEKPYLTLSGHTWPFIETDETTADALRAVANDLESRWTAHKKRMMRMKRPIDPKLTQAAAKRIIEAAEHRPLDPRVQAFLDRYFPTNRPKRAS